MTDGDKAAQTRNAIRRAVDHLPDTAHEPRHALLQLLDQPAVVLAALHDEICKTGVSP